MSTLPMILLSAVIGALIGFFVNAFFKPNVDKLVQEHQWDLFLTRFVKYAKEHKRIWLLSGLLFGFLSGSLITWFILPYITAEPYVNPIHDSRIKWNMVKWISGDKEQCHIVIARIHDDYAEDYANDWKEIFTVIRWPVTEEVPNTPIEKGIKFRPIQADAKAFTCAETLNTMFAEHALNKRGGPIDGGVQIYGYQAGEAVPNYLKECTSPCVEVDLGNPRSDQ